MKKLLCLLLAALSFQISNAQSANEIIQEYLKATGSKDLWSKVQSLQYSGNYVMGPGAEAPVKQLFTFKTLHYVSTFSWMGMQSKTVIQGDSGWTFSPFGGKRTIDPIPTTDIKSYILSANPNYLLLSYTERKYNADYLGLDDVEGVETYKVRIMSPDGDKFYFYFDAKTYYLIKFSYSIKLPTRLVKEAYNYSDFRKSAFGLVLPFQIQSVDDAGNESGGPIILKSVDVNATTDSNLFAKP